MTAPAYASHTELTQSPDSLSSNTLAGVARPSGTANGDLLVIFALDNTSAQLNTPTGWTALAPIAIGGGSTRLRVLWRIASGEPATYTLTRSNSGTWAGAMVRFTGTDLFDPIVGSRLASGTPSFVSSNAGLTLAVRDTLLVFACMFAGAIGTPPAGFDEFFNHTVTAGATAIATSDDYGNGGVTGAIAETLNVAAASANALLALQPPVVYAPFMQGASMIIATP